MIFEPINGHVEIQPIVEDTFIPSDQYDEKGRVVSVAKDVTKIEVGQIVYFDYWLSSKYPMGDGRFRYLIEEKYIRAIEHE